MDQDTQTGCCKLCDKRSGLKHKSTCPYQARGYQIFVTCTCVSVPNLCPIHGNLNIARTGIEEGERAYH